MQLLAAHWNTLPKQTIKVSRAVQRWKRYAEIGFDSRERIVRKLSCEDSKRFSECCLGADINFVVFELEPIRTLISAECRSGIRQGFRRFPVRAESLHGFRY
jgi:hypothetical protein